MQVIIRNKIRCNFCKDEIESKYCHDYVPCFCGRVAVDGGHEYLKRSFTESQNDYTDLSIVKNVALNYQDMEG